MKKEKVEEKEIKETTAKAKIKEDIDKKIVVKNQSEEKNETKPVKKTTKSKKEDSSNQKEEEKKEEVKSENPHKNKVMNILKNAKRKVLGALRPKAFQPPCGRSPEKPCCR